MVNKALRTEDIQQLHTFRFVIGDLSAALAREHNKRKMKEFDKGMIMTVYRGVRLTLAELEQFRSNEGKLISINGYLSTSRLPHVATSFAVNDIKRTDSVPVLFEIECQGVKCDR
jgi:DNA replication initiation complex subunit (GINS family)